MMKTSIEKKFFQRMHLTVYEQSSSLKLLVKDTSLIEEIYKYTKLLLLETI